MFGIGKNKKDKDGSEKAYEVVSEEPGTATSTVDVDEQGSDVQGEVEHELATPATPDTPDAPDKVNEEIVEEEPVIGRNEIRALRRSKYDEIANKFDKIFTLSHKSGKIVEIRAASSVHACKIIGWRPRHVKVVEVKSYKELQKEKETSMSSGSSKDQIIPAPNAENAPAL